MKVDFVKRFDDEWSSVERPSWRISVRSGGVFCAKIFKEHFNQMFEWKELEDSIFFGEGSKVVKLEVTREL
jgi:hypothetical protein